MDGKADIETRAEWTIGPTRKGNRMNVNAVDDIEIGDLKKSLYDDNAQILALLLGSHIKRFNAISLAVAKLLLDEKKMRGLFFCFDKPSSFYSRMFEPKIMNFKRLTFIDPITNISATKGVAEGTIVLANPFEDVIFNDGLRILGEVFGKVCDDIETCFEPVSCEPGEGAEPRVATRYDFILIDNLNSATYYLPEKKVENFVIGLIDIIRNLTNTKVIIMASSQGNPGLYQNVRDICNRELVF